MKTNKERTPIDTEKISRVWGAQFALQCLRDDPDTREMGATEESPVGDYSEFRRRFGQQLDERAYREAFNTVIAAENAKGNI